MAARDAVCLDLNDAGCVFDVVDHGEVHVDTACPAGIVNIKCNLPEKLWDTESQSGVRRSCTIVGHCTQIGYVVHLDRHSGRLDPMYSIHQVEALHGVV